MSHTALGTRVKYARMAPSKVMPWARRLKGLPVAKALEATQFGGGKAARLLRKALQAAIADAAHNAQVAADECRVENVVVEQGARMRRYWSRSRGMARPVVKRTSHIRVILAKA